MEIVTAEWAYNPEEDRSNYGYVVQVKEQRRLGTVRGNTKTIPQAPSIRVRIKADTPGLPKDASIKADLWTYGVAFKGRNRHEFIPPQSITDGEKLTHLRNGVHIACVDNICKLSEPAADGYRYAELTCFVTRGARVCSRRNHIAFRLSVVVEKEDYKYKRFEDTINLKGRDGKWLSKTQISKLVKPDFGDDRIDRVIPSISPIRTARMSISEKAMCPRECDQRKKKSAKGKKKRPIPSSSENIADNKKKPKVTSDNLELLKLASASMKNFMTTQDTISKPVQLNMNSSAALLLQNLAPLSVYNTLLTSPILQQQLPMKNINIFNAQAALCYGQLLPFTQYNIPVETSANFMQTLSQ